jgi:hypothetical protein
MFPSEALAGTQWTGSAELWLDPLGDVAQRSDCTMTVTDSGVTYTWSYEGSPQFGSIVLRDGAVEFTDSWHQPEPMTCQRLADTRGLFAVLGAYGPDGQWGWRISLSMREPSGQLVLQMTNIAPWGEEARAVRMVGNPAG